MFTRQSTTILLPRPAITGEAMLVLMDMLNDYGTAAYYGVETLGAGIFKPWFDMGDSYSSIHVSGIFDNVRLYFYDI